MESISWAPTSLAALAFARCGVSDGFSEPLAKLLNRIPLEALTAVRHHHPVLARLGCKTLGDVRRLPRGGVSRRFDQNVLTSLDQAYGLRPAAHEWVMLPETFSVKLELPGRVESADSLMFGANRLLLQMCGWLAARNSGATAFVMRWYHDTLRSKTAGEGGELVIRTAEPSRDVKHLGRLLGEHLAKVELLAPVGDIGIEALEVHSLGRDSKSLIPDTIRSGVQYSKYKGPTAKRKISWAMCGPLVGHGSFLVYGLINDGSWQFPPSDHWFESLNNKQLAPKMYSPLAGLLKKPS